MGFDEWVGQCATLDTVQPARPRGSRGVDGDEMNYRFDEEMNSSSQVRKGKKDSCSSLGEGKVAGGRRVTTPALESAQCAEAKGSGRRKQTASTK